MQSVSTFHTTAGADHEPASNNLARGLGWFSLALGAAELAIPRSLSALIGIEPGPVVSTVMRVFGAREIAAGLGVLMQPRRPMPLWARVAGDVIDLGMLGLAASGRRTQRGRLVGAIAAVAGVMALDVVAARRSQRAFAVANEPVTFSVTINKRPDEVYAAFRRFDQLPQFMDYLESVRELDAVRSEWTAKLPIGGTVSWMAEITEDVPGEVIAWQSTEDSRIKTRGRVTFTRTPGREMTEVRVEMQLGFTGIAPSATVAKLFAKPQVKGDLRRFKQVVETGEVLYSDASEHRRPHPAQPSEQIERRPEVFIPNPPTAVKGVTP